MVNVNYLFLFSLIWLTIIFMMNKFDCVINGSDVFAPGKIVNIFSVPPAIALMFLGWDSNNIYEFIFNRVSVNYRDINYVYYASLISIFSYVMVFLGVCATYKIKVRHIILNITWPSINKTDFISLPKHIKFLIFIGIFMAIYLLYKLGGIGEFWSGISNRVNNLSGFGYLNVFYKNILTFSGVYISLYLLNKKNYMKFFLFFIFISLVLVSTGSRSNLLSFIVSLVVTYHYCVKKLRLITFKNILTLVLVTIFLISFVKLRTERNIQTYVDSPSLIVSDVGNSIKAQVLMRFSRIERDLVILKYFDINSFWLGKSYISVISAPIPRSFYKNKPPVDNGLYLVKMAGGSLVNVPEKLENLPSYSWPLGNMEAYMNFGIFGLFIVCFLSGLIFGFFFKYVKSKNYNINHVILYSMLVFGGAPALSSMGIVNLLTFVFFGSLIILIIKLSNKEYSGCKIEK